MRPASPRATAASRSEAEEAAFPETAIAVALLGQRVACGVVNVYESEILFAGPCQPRLAREVAG